MREHETPRLGRQRRTDRQQPARAIEAAHGTGLVGTGDDVHPVPALQAEGDQRFGQRLGVELERQFLGGAVDAVDIIARLVKPVAHLLPWQPVVAGHPAGDAVVDQLEPLVVAAIGAVQPDEAIGELGLLLDHAVERVRSDGVVAEQRIGQRLAHRDDPVADIVRPRCAPFRREGARQRLGDRGRHRPVVIFELGQIADRQAKPRRHAALAEPGARAQRPERVPGEQPLPDLSLCCQPLISFCRL